MAAMESWEALERDLQAGLTECRALKQAEENEAQPYKSLYAAADLMKGLQGRVAAAAAAAGPDAPHPAAARRWAALLSLERGLALLDTDLLADADAELRSVVDQEWGEGDAQGLAWQLGARNALVALASQRMAFDDALAQLEAAQQLYARLRPQLPDAAPGAAAAPAGADAGAAASGEAPLAQQVEEAHTMTLFYLAQVHVHRGDKHAASLACAATLSRQLLAGAYEPADWVQNCLQLAGYFGEAGAFGVARYILEAAQAVADRARAAGATLGDDAQPAVEAGQQQQQAPGGGLDADVAANLTLAWAQHYLARLVASHKRAAGQGVAAGGQQQQPHLEAPDAFPEAVRFEGLPGLPAPADCPCGAAALAADFESARALFNQAMPRFTAALAHYKLDGWVTEHVDILFDASNLYRVLAAFEPDPRRKATMHKRRAKLLAPLEGQLNPQHYLGQARSISLELGNVWREVFDIQQEAGGEDASKVAASGMAAAQHYRSFLATFYEPGASQLPARVGDGNEAAVLDAAFSLGRALHRAAATGALAARDADECVRQAAGCLRWVADYGARNKPEGFGEQAGLAREMAELLAAKLEMTAAMRGSRGPAPGGKALDPGAALSAAVRGAAGTDKGGGGGRDQQRGA